jgi:hypothetical protein
MPTIETHTIKPGEARTNRDRLAEVDGIVIVGKTLIEKRFLIENVVRGPKNIRIETSGGDVLVAGNATITVERAIPTAEEAEEERQLRLIRDCKAQAERILAWSRHDPMKSLQSRAAKQRAWDLDEVLSWMAEGLLTQCEQLRLAKRLQDALDGVAEKHEDVELGDERFHAAIVKLMKWLRREVVNGARWPSRSTSPMSNFVEQQTLAVRADLLDDLLELEL